MKFFPESALVQLEFDKIKELLSHHCRTSYAKQKVQTLRIHTKKDFIQNDLQQTNEFKVILDGGLSFPNDFSVSLVGELKLLSITGAALTGEQFQLIKRLVENAERIFRWFDMERRELYPALSMVVDQSYYEKIIRQLIDEILDENGQVKDDASEALSEIRQRLYRKRNELRKAFDKIVSKLNKLGYLSEIEESFMNGRRVLAVYAEQKRMVKGVLHAESDSRRTSFIEPEETTSLNNEIFSLENEETKEVYRILRQLTADLSIYAPLLNQYLNIAGEFDFIRAKAKFAQDIHGVMPLLHDKAMVKLIQARHPLLYLYNNKSDKQTIPVDLSLDADKRILVISGPNAGGKTVTMKTVGLLQLMLQSGLLVSVSADSEMGIFKQMMIHIGDTQSIEFELSTYSAHLTHMKHFIENANGKTLFFIDELGSGSDPNLGGAFAEVIMEELARKHSMGIVTTHYLNLKVMANQVAGVFNGAMQFDEKNLLPLYKLKTGAPGSSYTFSIAERIGLDKKLIQRARKLVDDNHFKLDKLLNQSEQHLQSISKEKEQLNTLVKENEKLRKEMQELIDKEKHQQEIERLKLVNKVAEDKFFYNKEMERKLKAMVTEWKKAKDKASVVSIIQDLLFQQKEQKHKEKKSEKESSKYEELSGDIQIGSLVRMKKNRQTATVMEIRGKKALLKVGIMPMLVDIKDVVMIKEKIKA